MFTKKDFSRMYWLSGSVCSGKTTISSLIAERLNWNVYHSDEWIDQHREKASPTEHPTFYKISRITGDDLWLRPLEEQIATEESFSDEEFELIKEDLKQCLKEDKRPLLFDGYVSPHTLAPLLASPQHVYYLIATKEFQLHNYSKRPWINNVLAKTSDRKLAWRNWMQRDIASARILKEQVIQENLSWLSVDGSLNISETTNQIIQHYKK
ncbi:MAG: hypothetical protein WCW66_05250 [Patescibacteria group bacterium]